MPRVQDQRGADLEPGLKQVLDEPAYAAALTQLLIDAEIITEEDLASLAMARAKVVRDTLTAGEQVDPNRVTIAANETAQLNDTGWVPMQLELSSGGNSQSPESVVED